MWPDWLTQLFSQAPRPDWLMRMASGTPRGTSADTLRMLAGGSFPEVSWSMHPEDAKNTLGQFSNRFNTIYLNPILKGDERQPAVSDAYLDEAWREGKHSITPPPGYVLGHEAGHNIYERHLSFPEQSAFRAYVSMQAPNQISDFGASESFAQAYGDAYNLIRATAQGGTYGPEVREALQRLSPGAERAFRMILGSPVMENHPLRGWGRAGPGAGSQ